MTDRIQECGCGCGRCIELESWDIDGADWRQPEGFYDNSCQEWIRTECGDRKRLLCEACVACKEAEAIKSLASQIVDALATCDQRPADALSALRDMIAIEGPLGRRLRRMIAKQKKPVVPMDSSSEKTCRECQAGAA